ncbi:Ubiquitin carboxyl-terminal hydrolase [Spraguea lophii 42_110]|uniref:Ubiquitin carboxyl-terminal hydrolase n=1 Tax=Spraguea lophii (strain 42_110) TaxID=1358809 RepID=S7WC67_SPRLO|nr:Ubiquitin carboxyl-terminal hydrolase [Spraguea lophii 42_110]
MNFHLFLPMSECNCTSIFLKNPKYQKIIDNVLSNKKCSVCDNTTILHICISCYKILCRKDMIHNCNGNTYILVLIDNGYIYCMQCKKYKIHDNFTLNFRRKIIFSKHEEKIYKILPCYYIKGIQNLGNTCYVNSVLQILFIPKIRDNFLEVYDLKKDSLLYSLIELYTQIYSSTLLIPNYFLEKIFLELPYFQNDLQHDSHEFFTSLLNHIHHELSSKDICNCPVHNIFYGILLSEIKCFNCTKITSIKEEFLSLSLNLKKYHRVNDMLLDFFSKENVEGVCCKECNTITTIQKTIKIQKYPSILSIHFNRFLFKENKLSKNNRAISYNHIITVDDRVYKLLGAICHDGTIESGHYYSVVRYNSNWYLMNDLSVSIIKDNEAIRDNAYVLFYEKI